MYEDVLIKGTVIRLFLLHDSLSNNVFVQVNKSCYFNYTSTKYDRCIIFICIICKLTFNQLYSSRPNSLSNVVLDWLQHAICLLISLFIYYFNHLLIITFFFYKLLMVYFLLAIRLC